MNLHSRESIARHQKRRISQPRLYAILQSSIGSIQLHENCSLALLDQEFIDLEKQVINRLSIPLLLPDPIRKYRIAIVHARHKWATTRQFYEAARDMDIEVYVLAKSGHWMQEDIYTSYRKAVILIDITADPGLPNRIVDAIREFEVDGLVTFSDPYPVYVAVAAKCLGLPTLDPSVLEICRDKYLTRMIEPPPESFQCARVDWSNGQESFLDAMLALGELRYPLIVKPCSGWASHGVYKVNNEEELLHAAANANSREYIQNNLVTVESYISGPEVDANFILLDGVVLFVEISDQFPMAGDFDTATSESNFLETELFLPSALPPGEQHVIKEAMVRILSKLGCHNGIFHMEARMCNSSMEYRVFGDHFDLAPRLHHTGTPGCMILENNCRPPGSNSNAAILHTYGVDFFAIHLLIALGDHARARALSQPFAAGPQHHCDLVSIPAGKGGIFASTDATGDLLRRHPELKVNIASCGCYFSYGDMIPDQISGTLSKIAYFLVVSRVSRKEVLDTVRAIRKHFEFTIISRKDELPAEVTT